MARSEQQLSLEFELLCDATGCGMVTRHTPVMSAQIKSLALDTWAGRRYYAVELVGQTPKKARVRILTAGGVMLPGRRYVNFGETVLVPKHAVVDLPKDTHKVEQGYAAW